MTPGFFFDMTAAEYFGDPCPTPSLTQSIAKILIDKSPLHAWHSHPRLNPNWQPDDDTKFDIGNVAHKFLIGRGKDIMPLDFDDWRKKEAQMLRAAAQADGKLAVLRRQYNRAGDMADAARKQLAARRLEHLFDDGTGETVMTWKEPFWCRQMIDWLTHDRCTFADYKTTDMSAAPHALARKMIVDGWDVQAAMAERGIKTIDGTKPRRYFFIVQEATPPYALTVAELSEGILTMGRKRLNVAMEIWRRCIEHDVWPAYALDIVVPMYPGWAEAQWLDREQTEFAEAV